MYQKRIKEMLSSEWIDVDRIIEAVYREISPGRSARQLGLDKRKRKMDPHSTWFVGAKRLIRIYVCLLVRKGYAEAQRDSRGRLIAIRKLTKGNQEA